MLNVRLRLQVRTSRRPRRVRGFSLLEMSAAVAVLGVFAALAAPSFSQVSDRQRLVAGGEEVASALAFARSAAMAERRCTRVVLAGDAILDVEILNSFDCESATPATPYIDATRPLWSRLRRVELETQSLDVDFFPQATRTELRFRPTGRLHGPVDADGRPVAGAALRVTLPSLASSNTRQIVVESLGSICVLAGTPNTSTIDPPSCL